MITIRTKFQKSYIPRDSNRVFYLVENENDIIKYLSQPVFISNEAYTPRRPRFIQPIYGLEIAINGLRDLPAARSMIDRYIEGKYGANIRDKVVRTSRMELDESVYCVVLISPEISAQFVADPFTLFDESGINVSQPTYLYVLNSHGIPNVNNSGGIRTSSSVDAILPTLQHQVDSQSGQIQDIAASLRDVIQNQHYFVETMDRTVIKMQANFNNTTMILATQNAIALAQSTINNLQNSIQSAQTMLLLAKDEITKNIMAKQIENLNKQLENANQDRKSRDAELVSLQQQTRPALTQTSSVPPSSQNKSSGSRNNQDGSREEFQKESDTSDSTMQVDPAYSMVYFTFSLSSSHVLLSLSSLLISPVTIIPFLKGINGKFDKMIQVSCLLCVLSSTLPINNCVSPLSFISSFSSHAFAHFSNISPALRAFSINANGLGNAAKVASIQNMVNHHKPHLIVIGETKNVQPVSSRLKCSDYIFHESAGKQIRGQKFGKWGIIVGVRKDTFSAQRLPTPPDLDSRVIALDLFIPTTSSRGFRHRFIGAYAPWDVTENEEGNHLFWPKISDIVSNSRHSWSLIGDFNATLTPSETTSRTSSSTALAARNAYSAFLQHSMAADTWQSQDPDAHHHFTYKSYTGSNPTCSIIDRVATSRIGILSSSVGILSEFIPCTDHRPICSQLVLSPPEGFTGNSDLTEKDPVSYAPRFRYPPASEKNRLTKFSQTVDELLKETPSISDLYPTSDNTFQTLYSTLSKAILSSAELCFQKPSVQKSRPSTKITNPTIRAIIAQIRLINRMVGIVKQTPSSTALHLIRFPLNHSATEFFNSFLRAHPNDQSTSNFLLYLSDLRRQLHKIRFAEEKLELDRRNLTRSKAQIANVLHGGSSKRLYDFKFSELPMALTPEPDTEPNLILTGSEAVKNATTEYFTSLYHRTPRRIHEKPWISSPSVLDIKTSTQLKPLVWPQAISLPDLKRLTRKGNARPTPGPDGWEKWFLRNLSDHALSLVLRLLNFIIMNSHFPDCIKETNISTIFKRGSPSDLSNYRGIACSNIILNLVFSWLNDRLCPYLTSMHIIPSCQVATQPATQGRDLISYIAQIDKWASRTNTPLYILQRDQKKGFDMLEPQGFYDAIQAYGLPSSIIDLDQSSQENVPYRVKTAYGFTSSFMVNGVTKQGGSLSPIKCTLTTSLCNRWIFDLSQNSPGYLHISSVNSSHHPEIQSVPSSIVEAMDDTLMINTNLQLLKENALKADRFQSTYGWETSWPKSTLYLLNVPHWPSSEDLKMPSVDYTDPESSITFWHALPTVSDFITFLRVPINQPSHQFERLKGIIENFQFPLLYRKPPLTFMRRVISQRLISKIRPYLALQPLNPSDAEALDRLLASKVHAILGFPFRFNTELITAPLNIFGLEFPSISLLNSSLSTNGLLRDLNHHLPPFKNMADITLADWSCSSNGCLNPLTHPSISASSNHLPTAWQTAFKALKVNNLSIFINDLSPLISGNTSIAHLYNISRRLMPSNTPRFHKHLISSFASSSYHLLRDVGSTVISPFPLLLYYQPKSLIFPNSQYFLSRDFPILTSWLHHIPYLFLLITNNNTSTLLPKHTRQQLAERAIMAAFKNTTFPPHPYQTSDIATDASVNISFLSNKPSTNFSITTPTSSMVAKIPFPYPSDILHGETFAILAASVYAKHTAQPFPIKIFTDHLNSVNLLNNMDNSPLALKTNPARSMYRWIKDVWSSMQLTPHLEHIKAHTKSVDIPSKLNRLADSFASQFHDHSLPFPIFPDFHLDKFSLFSPSMGIFENNIATNFPRKISVRSIFFDKFSLPSFSSFNQIAPPPQPYFNSPSSYAAAVQLYSRSAQLDTNLTKYRRNLTSQPWCRFGCPNFEDAHHLFVLCPSFTTYRQDAQRDLRQELDALVHSIDTPELTQEHIQPLINNLFLDKPPWPSARSYYYLGLQPSLSEIPLPPRLKIRLSRIIHTISIRLAARIWGQVRRYSSSLYYSSRQNQTTSTQKLSLPLHLKSFIPLYDKFSLTFH
ncbi:hypothetical protein CVT24_007817 [Panaeolus cyanescens]|uniref:Endonuclease/exonuclease/phosphatase domain-containing protein n=1 Tax=Panaeolus cyanescens TaxID=181874 RepID=A0A409W4U3_9AGAR|nr:hypothetical protein CVT24_007817 [Panaeolus cyanescens]